MANYKTEKFHNVRVILAYIYIFAHLSLPTSRIHQFEFIPENLPLDNIHYSFRRKCVTVCQNFRIFSIVESHILYPSKPSGSNTLIEFVSYPNNVIQRL